MIHKQSELHLHLKGIIKNAHDKLDHQPILSQLLGDVSLEGYANALAALHGVYEAVEKNIMNFLANQPDLFDYQSRLKTQALEEDLKELEKPPYISNIGFPIPKNIAELVGMIYVLEGSTMGGQFLSRKIGNKYPMRFFSGYGDNTAQKWQEFWVFANSVCSVEQYEDIGKMAILLFELIESHLQDTTQNV
jgi:heme oxygenase